MPTTMHLATTDLTAQARPQSLFVTDSSQPVLEPDVESYSIRRMRLIGRLSITSSMISLHSLAYLG